MGQSYEEGKKKSNPRALLRSPRVWTATRHCNTAVTGKKKRPLAECHDDNTRGDGMVRELHRVDPSTFHDPGWGTIECGTRRGRVVLEQRYDSWGT